jgi:hypothetical protein
MKILKIDEIYKSGAIPMESSGSFTSEIFDTSFITGNLILEWLVNGDGAMQITLLASSDGITFTAAPPAPIVVNQAKSNGLSNTIFSLPAGSTQIKIQFEETGMDPISVVYSLRASNAIDGTPIGATTPAPGTFTTLKGKSDEIIVAATGPLAAAQMLGQIINNYGQTADVTMTLDAASKGAKFTVILGTTVDKAFNIAPAAGVSIYVAGVTTGSGKYFGIASAAIGAAVKFEAFQTGANAWSWNATVISGTWAPEGS